MGFNIASFQLSISLRGMLLTQEGRSGTADEAITGHPEANASRIMSGCPSYEEGTSSAFEV